METYQVVIVSGIEPSHAEVLREYSESYSCDGIEEYSVEEAQADSILGERSYSGGDLPFDVLMEVEDHMRGESNQSLKFYFCGEKNLERAEAFFQTAQGSSNIKINIRREEKKEEDWNALWMESFTAIEIPPLLEIIPCWEKESHLPRYPHTLLINPGMAFGTGHHETTFLCLQLLESSNKQGACLDFGCGSGILALAAVKLGYDMADLYDIDTKALENAKENISLNFQQQESRFRLFLPQDRSRLLPQYSLIVANILENILLQERDFLIGHLQVKGKLILSGILLDQLENVAQNYVQTGLVIEVKRLVKGDWGALVFEKADN